MKNMLFNALFLFTFTIHKILTISYVTISLNNTGTDGSSDSVLTLSFQNQNVIPERV